MSAPRSVNLDNYKYASNTPFEIPFLFPIADYPLDAVRAEFQIEKEGVVVYRITSWETPAAFDIDTAYVDPADGVTKGLIMLTVSPLTASLDGANPTFGAVIGGDEGDFDYRVDVGQNTDSVTEYRFQGLMNVLESHGPTTSRV